MKYECEAQKNILEYQYRNICNKYKLNAVISLIAESTSLLFKKYSPTAVKMLIDYFAYNRDSFSKNCDKWPPFIKTLYHLVCGDRHFIESHFDIDCAGKVGKERKKHIKGFIDSVKLITFGHLVSIDVQLSKDAFYKAKKAEKKALVSCGIFGEKSLAAMEKEAILENILEEKEAIDEKENLAVIQKDIGQEKEHIVPDPSSQLKF
jgi:hypothetical protein